MLLLLLYNTNKNRYISSKREKSFYVLLKGKKSFHSTTWFGALRLCTIF
uniref:Uncharacterized protein n=1 Tax=Arundo donax TaxID=35708 RepID=A0A0A9Q5L4_ARUDO